MRLIRKHLPHSLSTSINRIHLTHFYYLHCILNPLQFLVIKRGFNVNFNKVQLTVLKQGTVPWKTMVQSEHKNTK